MGLTLGKVGRDRFFLGAYVQQGWPGWPHLPSGAYLQIDREKSIPSTWMDAIGIPGSSIHVLTGDMVADGVAG